MSATAFRLNALDPLLPLDVAESGRSDYAQSGLGDLSLKEKNSAASS